MTTQTPAKPPTKAPVVPRDSMSYHLSDLAIGVRLAVRSGRAGWLRLALSAGGIGMCVAVLLLGASFNNALDNRAQRAESLNPATFQQTGEPVDSPAFLVRSYTQTYRGLLVTGVDVAPLDPGAAIPPGLSAFPAPGTLAVSPALRDLLASSDGDLLRPRLAAPIAAIIDDGGLTSPTDLRFYRGVEPAAVVDQDGSNSGVGRGWGVSNRMSGEYFDNIVTKVAVITGAAVVLVPLLIFVALMSRLGSATRERRSAVLGLIGATGAQRRRVLAGETLVGALAGVVLGAVGFFVIRSASWLRVAGDRFFPSDISPQPWLAALIAIGVPMIATAAAVSGVRRSPHSSKAISRKRPRIVGWRIVFVVVVLALIAVQVISGPVFFGEEYLVIVGGTVLLALLLVPVLLPPLLTLVANILPEGGLAWHLAVRRLQSNVGAVARSVAGISVVVAAGIVFQSMLAVTGTVVANGYHADKDPDLYRVQVASASQAEIADLTASLLASPGVTAVTGGSYVWLSSTPGGSSFEAFIAACPQIEATSGITNCRDGDVFRVAEYGSVAITTGSTLSAYPAADGSPRSWTLPAAIREAQPNEAMYPFAPYLIVTNGALGSGLDRVLQDSFVYLAVRVSGPQALDQLRNIVGDFGSRANVSSNTEWAADSTTIRLTSTMRTGLIIGGGLTLLVALLGLLVLAVEQLIERRRALTLTVAAGVPRALIARSFLAGATIPAVTGAALGIAIGALLTYYVSTISGALYVSPTTRAFPPDLLATSLIGITAVLATLLVTAVTLPALPALTRLEKLRTG